MMEFNSLYNTSFHNKLITKDSTELDKTITSKMYTGHRAINY